MSTMFVRIECVIEKSLCIYIYMYECDLCVHIAKMMTLNSLRYDCFHGDRPLIPKLSRVPDCLGFVSYGRQCSN